MTPTEQNIAIAEWMGWTRIPTKASNPHKFWKDPKINCFYSEDDLPDCYGDLNAIHEAESNLHEKQRADHIEALSKVTQCDGWEIMDTPDQFDMIHASAPQRCEALLRTIDLWR